MLTQGNARRAFELLDTSGLLAHVLPEAVRMHGVQQPPDWHPEGDVWTHTMLLLEKLPLHPTPTLAWGALLHDIGKPATFQIDRSGSTPEAPRERIRFSGHVDVGVRIAETILRRLRFSNEDIEQIVSLWSSTTCASAMFPPCASPRSSASSVCPGLTSTCDLHWLDCSACHGRLGIWQHMKQRFEAEPEPDTRPHLLLTGRDLIRAGYQPGPTFKSMLEAAEDAQLEGTLHTPEQALLFLFERFGPPATNSQPNPAAQPGPAR